MKTIMSCFGATSVAAATFAAASIVPATGAPILLTGIQIAHPSDVTYVRDGMGWRGNGFRGGGWRHGGNWRGGHWPGSGFHGGGYYGWHNGYGGYYNDNDDLWIAGGALVLGALIGSAIANSGYYGNNYYGYYGNNYYEDRYVGSYRYRDQNYRYRDYNYRYRGTPYRAHTADPYLGWQRALDR